MKVSNHGPLPCFFSIGGAEIHGIHEECGGQSTSAGAVSGEMVGFASEEVLECELRTIPYNKGRTEKSPLFLPLNERLMIVLLPFIWDIVYF